MLPDSGREGSTEQVQSLDVKFVERRHQIRWRKQIFHDDRFSFEPQSGMILVSQASLALGQDITFLFFVVLDFFLLYWNCRRFLAFAQDDAPINTSVHTIRGCTSLVGRG